MGKEWFPMDPVSMDPVSKDPAVADAETVLKRLISAKCDPAGHAKTQSYAKKKQGHTKKSKAIQKTVAKALQGQRFPVPH